MVLILYITCILFIYFIIKGKFSEENGSVHRNCQHFKKVKMSIVCMWNIVSVLKLKHLKQLKWQLKLKHWKGQWMCRTQKKKQIKAHLKCNNLQMFSFRFMACRQLTCQLCFVFKLTCKLWCHVYILVWTVNSWSVKFKWTLRFFNWETSVNFVVLLYNYLVYMIIISLSFTCVISWYSWLTDIAGVTTATWIIVCWLLSWKYTLSSTLLR